jgi:diadenosine tetraphosphatase ApaH/serine/threonine PP2A family protein phosphatase
VHGNLEALDAVLADAALQGATGLLCLGDVVGYGADPVACVERLGERTVAAVAGNHEWGALGLMDLEWFNPVARAAALWTSRQLDADHARYLGRLPLTTTVEDATLAHASPNSPEEWDYLMSAEEGFAAFRFFETRLCFVGHSHRPTAWSVGSSGRTFQPRLPRPEGRLPLDDGRRYLVNVGSVGQPRDRDPRASYALWDRDARDVSIRRVSYDHKRAAEKILKAGLPPPLAHRLAHGV